MFQPKFQQARLQALAMILLIVSSITLYSQTDKGAAINKNGKLLLNECLSFGSDKLILQQDGNLIYMKGNVKTWESNTGGQGVSELVLQENNCTVVLNKANNGGVAWSFSGLTRCAPNVELVIQSGGIGLIRGLWIDSGSGGSTQGDSKAIWGMVIVPQPGEVEP